MSVPIGRRVTSRAAHVLVLLAVVALLVADGSLAHVHETGEPGIYNHDHDLTAFATFGSGGGLVADAPVVAFAAILIALVAFGTARPAPAPHRHADPRGPPLR